MASKTELRLVAGLSGPAWQRLLQTRGQLSGQIGVQSIQGLDVLGQFAMASGRVI